MSKQTLFAALCLVFLAVSAEASIFQKQEVSGYDCAGNMTTDDCFGPTATGSSGPYVTKCEAYGANNQKCRDCMTAYNDQGIEQTYKTCNYVSRNAACDCEPVGVATCTSNTGSTCTYKVWS